RLALASASGSAVSKQPLNVNHSSLSSRCSRWSLWLNCLSAPPQDTREDAQDLDVARRIDDDRRHGSVGRFQADAIPFAEELLQRHLVVDHGDNPFAVLGRLLFLDDNIIAVLDVVFDHRVATDLEHIATGA